MRVWPLVMVTNWFRWLIASVNPERITSSLREQPVFYHTVSMRTGAAFTCGTVESESADRATLTQTS